MFLINLCVYIYISKPKTSICFGLALIYFLFFYHLFTAIHHRLIGSNGSKSKTCWPKHSVVLFLFGQIMEKMLGILVIIQDCDQGAWDILSKWLNFGQWTFQMKRRNSIYTGFLMILDSSSFIFKCNMFRYFPLAICWQMGFAPSSNAVVYTLPLEHNPVTRLYSLVGVEVQVEENFREGHAPHAMAKLWVRPTKVNS